GTTLLANDTDVDNDHVLSIASVSGDSHVSLLNENVVFNPGSDFISLGQGDSEIVTFSYVVQDEFGALSNAATDTIKVLGLNDAPVASDISSTVDAGGGPFTLDINATDPDSGDIVSLSAVGTSNFAADGVSA